MAGNAIAWKENYAEAQPTRGEGWLSETWHFFNALLFLILADRAEGKEQSRAARR